MVGYYCYKCNKKHLRGKLFESHKNLNINSLSYKLLTVTKKEIYSFSDIITRQLFSLFKRRTANKKFRMYNLEINKVILYSRNKSSKSKLPTYKQ